ncbi:hypothetical protein ZEAMMB73_Zm00001d030370 [Zea mays]|uniref:Uncharacterized protein n=1 Tax=Zea mays TaxID=4577 RepID=A0A1D6KCA9_MAIZE|nr:hypothetical protein ZEAMMB73_Zm00001d030370 [Zea mays]
MAGLILVVFSDVCSSYRASVDLICNGLLGFRPGVICSSD